MQVMENQARSAQSRKVQDKPDKSGWFLDAVRDMRDSLVSWEWTKSLLYWMIMSAGTMSECAFLVASLWMSINASVHPLVLAIMPESLAIRITQITDMVYVALPEMIVALACVTTINHLKTFLYDRKKNKISLVWAMLTAPSTVIFLGLSGFTLFNSVVNTTFIMPTIMIQIRALSGYWFAFIGLLYAYIGKPSERERLAVKDGLIVGLRQAIERLKQEHSIAVAELNENHSLAIADIKRRFTVDKNEVAQPLNEDIQRLKAELFTFKTENESLKGQLDRALNQNTKMLNTIKEVRESASEADSNRVISWLSDGLKSTTRDVLIDVFGVNNRDVTSALSKKELRLAPRSKDKILKSSAIKWLESIGKLTLDSEPLINSHVNSANTSSEKKATTSIEKKAATSNERKVATSIEKKVTTSIEKKTDTSNEGNTEALPAVILQNLEPLHVVSLSRSTDSLASNDQD